MGEKELPEARLEYVTRNPYLEAVVVCVGSYALYKAARWFFSVRPKIEIALSLPRHPMKVSSTLSFEASLNIKEPIAGDIRLKVLFEHFNDHHQETLIEMIVKDLLLGTYAIPIKVAPPQINDSAGYLIVAIEEASTPKNCAEARRFVAYPTVDGKICRHIAL